MLVTESLLFLDCRFVRLKDVDQDLLPDATIWLGKHKIHLEVETGANRPSQIPFEKYDGGRYLVLWIAMTDARMQGIIQEAQKFPIGARSLFTTKEHCAKRFRDVYGKWMSVDELRRQT